MLRSHRTSKKVENGEHSKNQGKIMLQKESGISTDVSTEAKKCQCPQVAVSLTEDWSSRSNLHITESLFHSYSWMYRRRKQENLGPWIPWWAMPWASQGYINQSIPKGRCRRQTKDKYPKWRARNHYFRLITHRGRWLWNPSTCWWVEIYLNLHHVYQPTKNILGFCKVNAQRRFSPLHTHTQIWYSSHLPTQLSTYCSKIYNWINYKTVPLEHHAYIALLTLGES